MSKSVLVIGAGPSGLVSVKECLANGLDVDCVDAAHEIGGVFGASPDCVYDNLYLTTSNVFMAFSDFPPVDDWIRYSRKEEYAQYLVDYAETFKLTKHVQLKTCVDEATWCETSKKWKVKFVDVDSKKGLPEKTYDAIMCCTGANQEPKMPLNEALKDFKGQVMHSSDYKNKDEFKGKRVLCVGIGESASDITTEVSYIAKETYSWSRHEVMYAPRFPEQNVLDPKHDEAVTLVTDQKHMKISDFLEAYTTSRYQNNCVGAQFGLLRQFLWKMGMIAQFNVTMTELCRGARACVNHQTWRVYCQADQAIFATKNARLSREVALGKVDHIIAQKIEKVDGNCITFSNGRSVEVDAVLCCTGYKQNFKWLKTDVGCLCPRSWYKHCFPACYDKIPICFVGYARGHQGGIPQMAEMVARLATLELTGQVKLPKNYKQAIVAEGKAEQDYYVLSPELKTLVDYPAYMESIAKIIGCRPTMPFWNPVQLFKYLFYPLWSSTYRLRGPGANPKAAKAVYAKFPISKAILPTPMYVIATCNLFWCKLVISPLFYFFTPNVGVDRFNLWLFTRPKMFLLHGNRMSFWDLFRI